MTVLCTHAKHPLDTQGRREILTGTHTGDEGHTRGEGHTLEVRDTHWR